MLLLKYEKSLHKSKLIKRYKRFLMDVLWEDGSTQTIHCANSGSMLSCLPEGVDVYSLESTNPARKLKHTLELMNFDDGFACLNTMRANQLVEQLFFHTIGKSQNSHDPHREAFAQLGFPYDAFREYSQFKREAVFSPGTRFDFCLSHSNHAKKCWVEIKSVSLKLEDNTWAFPDAVSLRGQKHLTDLMQAKQQGDDAWLFFVIMRSNNVEPMLRVKGFRAAHEIDSRYAELLRMAKKQGVQVGFIVPRMTLEGLFLSHVEVLKNVYEQ